MRLLLAIQAVNSGCDDDRLVYDCRRCLEDPGHAMLMGHFEETVMEGFEGQPYHHDLGPWTEEFKLRTCPTKEVEPFMNQIARYLTWVDRIENGMLPDARGAGFWPNPLLEAFDVITHGRKLKEAYVREGRPDPCHRGPETGDGPV